MAARRLRILPQARHDLDSETIYLSEQADVDTAQRFFEAAQDSFRDLLNMPGVGKVRLTDNPRLEGIRQWTVSGFEKYLIFYFSRPIGVDIIRVIHGARDIDRILEDETSLEQ